MLNPSDLTELAQGAAQTAIEYVRETVCPDPNNPTQDEIDSVATVLACTIAILELNLKASLPEPARHNTRAFLDQWSAFMGAALTRRPKNGV
jgi:hypothetical protein